MSDLDAAAPSDLLHLPVNFISMMLQSMSLRDRFTCALVCTGWAEAATAVTRSIVLRPRVKDLSCLQRWLEKHGGQLKALQLNQYNYTDVYPLPQPLGQHTAVLTALALSTAPRPAAVGHCRTECQR